MSRLFEALKTASKLREGADGGAGDEVWKALGVEDLAAHTQVPVDSSAVSEEEQTGSVAVEDAPAQEEESSPPAAEVRPVAAVAPRLTGISQKTVLDKKARVIPHIIDSAIVERYRMLRAKIMHEREKNTFKTLMVASANPQEGKTVTVMNLALSFATLPAFRVLVVDGDMRRGTLGSWLGVDDNRPGLSNLIDGSAGIEDVVMQSTDLPMHFVLRGNSQAHDLEFAHYGAAFQKLADAYDLVIIDSPPVNVITDAQLMAASCDAVLLVARAFSTSRKALEHAVENLRPFRIIGTILNAGDAQGSHRYNGYYY